MIERILAVAAVCSNTTMLAAAANTDRVSHENIDFSLPIFIAAVASTAIFVWAIAKYDASRTAKILRTELRMQLLVEQMEKRNGSIEDAIGRAEHLLSESQELLRSSMQILDRIGKQDR